MQIQRKNTLWVVTGSGPKTGTASHAALAILKREIPTPFSINGLKANDIFAAKEGLFRFDSEVSREDQKYWQVWVPRDPEFNEPDDGIIIKDEVDRKIYLHWRPDLERLLAGQGILLASHQQEWFAYCARIHTACCLALQSLAHKMDMIRPGFRFAERVEEAWDQHCLRILQYEPRAGELARCHTDRCAITYHIAESADGLRASNGWDSVPWRTPAAPEVLCFSGRQFESITCGAVPALYHRVVDTTRGSRRRWAMVFFGKMPKDAGTY